MKKTVVLGLDGATWKLLKPFADNGTMPNLKRILDAGLHATLESTMPAMTAPAWVTFVTGKHPGKHGIFDFMLPQDSLRNMKFATSRDIQSKTLYELLHENGIKPILVNLPGTFPPKLNNEIIITSLLTQGDEWIFPASLKQEFPGFSKYRLTPDESTRIKERTDAYIEDLLRHLEEQITCVKWLFEHKPWDFFFYLFSHTDWISHLMYTELEERHDPAGVRVFQKIDEHLGWFLEHLPAEANLILMSDHGFKAYKKVFYFNRWLEQQGYLVTNTDADQFRGAATRRAKEKDKILAGQKKLHVGNSVVRFLHAHPRVGRVAKWAYHRVLKRYVPVNIKVNIGIDYSKTKVCFPKGIYITNAYINKAWVYNDGVVQKEDYTRLRDEVVEKMRAIRDPEGQPVVAEVLTREDVYGEHAPEQAPDIFFTLTDYWLVGEFHSQKLFAREKQDKHDSHGIFLAMGPDFPRGVTTPTLDMQDMTPVMLHLLGLPVPSDCDGRVPQNLFAPESDAARRPVRIGEPTQKKLPSQNSAGAEKTALKQALSQIQL